MNKVKKRNSSHFFFLKLREENVEKEENKSVTNGLINFTNTKKRKENESRLKAIKTCIYVSIRQPKEAAFRLESLLPWDFFLTELCQA